MTAKTGPSPYAAAMQAGREKTKKSKKPASRAGRVAWVSYHDEMTARRLKAAAALAGLNLDELGREAAAVMIERYLPR